jgi:hypothetical protein
LADTIQRIVVLLHMGSDRLAATDDPVFLGLRGPVGREFRLGLGHGKALRRKGEERYVFGAPDDAETNVASPELNDPTAPPLDAEQVTGVYLRKRQEPIPNVRGHGELDDRLQLDGIEVEIETARGARRYRREGPIWLGLACGLSFDLAPVDGV